MEWEKTLDKYGLMVENRLSTFLNKELKEAEDYHSFISELYKELYDYIRRGGKRLASCSTLLVYKGFKNAVDDKILDICVGIELYRHAILIHDDLVDDDELRRGAKTIHKIYSEKQDTRFGEGVAVFAGNILYTLSLKALGTSDFETEKKIRILNTLNQAFQTVNDSQILDLLFEYKTPDVDEWYVMASKRASSLFKASISIGCILAEASEEDQRLLKKAAEHIGYSFDIQDDIIDTFASEKQYGRRPGGDLAKNKKPLHIVHTYMMADQQQLKTFEKAVKNTSKNLGRIKEIISESGALEEAKNHSRRHAESAKKNILDTSMNSEVKSFFISFIDYVKESLNWYM